MLRQKQNCVHKKSWELHCKFRKNYSVAPGLVSEQSDLPMNLPLDILKSRLQIAWIPDSSGLVLATAVTYVLIVRYCVIFASPRVALKERA